MSQTKFEITIEVPRWGFIKRGSTDKIDFISPIPALIITVQSEPMLVWITIIWMR